MAFPPDLKLVKGAPKGKAFEITSLEIRTGKCLVVHTGDEHEDEFHGGEIARLAICSRDTGERGSKKPLFYPPRCQVLLETEIAEIVFRKMLVQAMVDAGLPLDKLSSSEIRGIAATSLDVPVSEVGQHRFSDLATLLA